MSKICVCVSHSEWFDVIDSALKAKSEGADIIEIRLDALKGAISRSTLDTLGDLKRDVSLPMIITLRPQREGGGFSQKEETRVLILKEIIKRGFDYVDLELRMDGLARQELLKLAREHNVKTIISYHDYDKTPSSAQLNTKVTECQDVRGDMAKVAVYNHSIEDAYRVLLAATSARGINVPYSVMGMGPAGYITRVLGPHVGCEIVYSALNPGKIVQEGHIPIMILREIWKFLDVK